MVYTRTDHVRNRVGMIKIYINPSYAFQSICKFYFISPANIQPQIVGSFLSLFRPMIQCCYGSGFAKMRPALTLILNALLAVTALAATEYHYHADTQILRRPTTLRPVTFNGVAIGTTELNKTAEPGTLHSLTDGHHFFHEDWYLSNSSSSGPVWEYLSTRRNASSSPSPQP